MILHIILDFIVFIVTVGILITVHECGHFLAARFFKIKIEQFSIGFGPVLWSWIGSDGTKYIISVFLIGGYVKLLDQSVKEVYLSQESNDFLNFKSVWRRSIIVLAGPFFNFIFSVLLYTVIFIIGIPIYKPIIHYILPNSIIAQNNILTGSEIKLINNIPVNDWESVRLKILHNINKACITITTKLNHNQIMHENYVVRLPDNWLNQSIIDTKDPIIALGMLPNAIYVRSIILKKDSFFFDKQNFLQIGDKILLINSNPIYNWESFIQMIKNSSKKKFDMTIERHKKLLHLNCSVYESNINYIINTNKNMNLFLATLAMKSEQNLEIKRYGLFTAVVKACQKTWMIISIITKTLGQVFQGNIKIADLHGPIAIAKGAEQSIRSGYIYYLMFLAIVSINLGIINLLPIPMLDGGQLFLLLSEKIKGSSVSQKTQNFIYMISIIILIFISFLALYNDIITWS